MLPLGGNPSSHLEIIFHREFQRLQSLSSRTKMLSVSHIGPYTCKENQGQPGSLDQDPPGTSTLETSHCLNCFPGLGTRVPWVRAQPLSTLQLAAYLGATMPLPNMDFMAQNLCLFHSPASRVVWALPFASSISVGVPVLTVTKNQVFSLRSSE